MASPLVCILEGKDGKDGVRMAVDYRFVNRFTLGDAYPMREMGDTIQKMGRAKFISIFMPRLDIGRLQFGEIING